MIELPVLGAGAAPEKDPSDLTYWRSASHYRRDAESEAIVRSEFMPGASEPPSGTSRRQFMQIMGASMALAGLTACRKPVEAILPYTRKPEEVIPGVPLTYATAMPFRGVLRPLIVESHDGRPTKVEGNADHPTRTGASGVFEQASILNLYDPDRSQQVLRDGSAATWDDFVAFVQDVAVGAGRQRLAVLAEPTSSMTMQALREHLQERFPQVRWIDYHGAGDDAARLGLQQAFGRPLRPQYRFSEANVIVGLDADFLDPTNVHFVHNTREFSESRRLDDDPSRYSRLYAVESGYSVTGANADNRLRLRSSAIPAFAAALAARVGATAPAAGNPYADHPFVLEMARDLQRAGRRGVVLAGEGQPPAVHALCAAVNSRLGSVGTVVELLDTGEAPVQPQAQELAALVADMRAGRVDTLLMLNTNPVYDAPAELNFAEAMQQVGETIHLGLHVNETAQASRWHLPQTHYLEAWSDGRSYEGTMSVVQPLIAPLYDTAHSDLEVVNLLATGLDLTGYDLVRTVWRGVLSGGFENSWRRVLHDGYLPDTQYPTVSAAAASVELDPMLLRVPAEDELEVVFRLDPTVLDGSFANNAWLQELPDPGTKIVWDNVAAMSPMTAATLGLNAEIEGGQYYVDLVTLTLGGQAVTLPVWVQPGLADGSIQLNLGYGRTIASLREERNTNFLDVDDYTDIYGEGAVATGVGVNVAPLRGLAPARYAVGAAAAPAGGGYMIATTQDHATLEGRPLYRMATLAEFQREPEFATALDPKSPGEPWQDYPALWEDDHPRVQDAYKDAPYYRNQWGMTIDLNTCTGCNACVVACQSENNIQVVGKAEVARGREMHWIRIDRYFVSPAVEFGGEMTDAHQPPAEAMMVMQPVPCMHCENAPCESVCPVAATVHSPDGTNQMIYNRCIGTRYCANNCPYKVRRFNFFNWSKTLPVTVGMALNPNVTVRSRGVMEKCSFCIQRIREANIRANLEDRGVQEGEVQTACQQACPAQAITFGDLNNPNSPVSLMKRNPRNYEMLAELSVKPRTSYLARVRNPNPGLEGVVA